MHTSTPDTDSVLIEHTELAPDQEAGVLDPDPGLRIVSSVKIIPFIPYDMPALVGFSFFVEIISTGYDSGLVEMVND